MKDAETLRPADIARLSSGSITSAINTTGLVGTGTPRQMEFALRLNF
jgi:hypothetical protein